jgi:hypothetical protein
MMTQHPRDLAAGRQAAGTPSASMVLYGDCHHSTQLAFKRNKLHSNSQMNQGMSGSSNRVFYSYQNRWHAPGCKGCQSFGHSLLQAILGILFK